MTGDGCLLALRARLRKQLCTQKQGAPKYTFTGGEQRFTGGEQSPVSLNGRRKTAGMVTSVIHHRHPPHYKQLIIRRLRTGDRCGGFFFHTDCHRRVKRKSTDSKDRQVLKVQKVRRNKSRNRPLRTSTSRMAHGRCRPGNS